MKVSWQANTSKMQEFLQELQVAVVPPLSDHKSLIKSTTAYTGFSDVDIPAPYMGVIRLQRGECTLWIHEPSILDRHPWTLVLKISGQSTETSRTTEPTLPSPSPDGPVYVCKFLGLFSSSAPLLGSGHQSERGLRNNPPRRCLPTCICITRI